MMITIFGATGMVGRQLVKQALIKGYKVKAFGRDVYTSFDEHDHLQLIQGALFDANQVLHAIEGSDALFSVLGGGLNGIDKTRSLGIKNIVAQMQKTGPERILALGDIGILDGPDDKLLMDDPGFPSEYLPVAAEHYLAYKHLSGSSLDWTFVCSPEIINAEVTGSYHTALNQPPVPDNRKINSGDLAMFMLAELVKNEYVKQRVGISN